MALVLRSRGHAVTVEMALRPELMISAAELAQPDLIICPFLTKRVPSEVYTRWLTLIVHPGAPGDAGPSAIDYALFGDLGNEADAGKALAALDESHSTAGAQPTFRSHWAVTVLQAIETLDAGPIWAWDQFELDAEAQSMSKSDLYRGPVTRAAVRAVLAAVDRIVAAGGGATPFSTTLPAPAEAALGCVSQGLGFQGGATHERPLLKASSRDFVPLTSREGAQLLNADVVVQRINSSDSQPGVLTSLFGSPLFVYGATVQRDPIPARMQQAAAESRPGKILATRESSVLVNVGAEFPIWLSHVRRPKAKTDKFLHAKLPAVQGLLDVPGLAEKLGLDQVDEWSATQGDDVDAAQPWKHRPGTYQQVWIDMEGYEGKASPARVAYVHFDFYNGATATDQCSVLVSALEWALVQPGLTAVVLLGGAGYFSNGIALNVIEGSSDPAAESWANINRIDDVVQKILAPAGILTVAAIRGNVAAGGLALATAADVVLCTRSAVLNPHYRGLGLYGSEYHTYSWYERCGSDKAREFCRTMLPMSAEEAKDIGLVDHVIGNGSEGQRETLEQVKAAVRQLVTARADEVESDASGLLRAGAPWTKSTASTLPSLRKEAEHSTLVQSILAAKEAYLTRLFSATARRTADGTIVSFTEGFAAYRRAELDNMRLDFFHPVRSQRYHSRRVAFVRKLVPSNTPARFALHRRFGSDWANVTDAERRVPLEVDQEELDAFDSLGEVANDVAVVRMPATTVKEETASASPATAMVHSDSFMSTATTQTVLSDVSATANSHVSTAASSLLSFDDALKEGQNGDKSEFATPMAAPLSGGSYDDMPTPLLLSSASREQSVDLVASINLASASKTLPPVAPAAAPSPSPSPSPSSSRHRRRSLSVATFGLAWSWKKGSGSFSSEERPPPIPVPAPGPGSDSTVNNAAGINSGKKRFLSIGRKSKLSSTSDLVEAASQRGSVSTDRATGAGAVNSNSQDPFRALTSPKPPRRQAQVQTGTPIHKKTLESVSEGQQQQQHRQQPAPTETLWSCYYAEDGSRCAPAPAPAPAPASVSTAAAAN